jgi:mannose-6-phosphate isomerase-like protein (cupin superfamily)
VSTRTTEDGHEINYRDWSRGGPTPPWPSCADLGARRDLWPRCRFQMILQQDPVMPARRQFGVGTDPFIARSGEGNTVHSFGFEDTRIIVPGEATHGAYAIWMHVSQPGSSPPRHIHRNEDEIIHVLEGELRIWCDGTAFMIGRGDTVTLPRGLAHSFRVIGSNPAHMMMTVVPGGFERFYAAVSRLRLPNDIPDLLDISEVFGIAYVGRPLPE